MNVNCSAIREMVVIVNNLIITIEGYFEPNPQYNLCYCEDCLKGRNDKKVYERGIPPKKYTLPTGWSRFSLRYASVVFLSQMSLFDVHVSPC